MSAFDLGIHFHTPEELAIACPFCGVKAAELCYWVDADDEPRDHMYAHASRVEEARSLSRRSTPKDDPNAR